METALGPARSLRDRKSTRLNSSHVEISYAVFCLKKKNRDAVLADDEPEQISPAVVFVVRQNRVLGQHLATDARRLGIFLYHRPPTEPHPFPPQHALPH